MSEVKVNKISPRTGTTFTIGDAGDTVTTAGDISALNITATNSLTVLIMLLLTLSLRLHQDQDLIIFVCQMFF